MNKILPIAISLLLFGTWCFGQGWEKTLGGENVDIGYSVLVTADGGMMVSGATTSFDHEVEEVYVARLDVDGDLIWENTYGADGKREFGLSMIATSDGNYVIAGYQVDTALTANPDIYLLKIDPLGNQIWEQSMGGEATEEANSIIETQDGGLALIGDTESTPDGDRDIYFLKLDANGQEEWSRTFGNDGRDRGWALIQNLDGTYALVGYIENLDNDIKESYIILTDSNGDEIWSTMLGQSAIVAGASIIHAEETGYVVACYIDQSTYMVHVEEDGIPTWFREIDELNITFGHSLIAMSNGGYLMAGGHEVGFQDDNVLLVRTDADGEELWRKSHGGLGERDYALYADPTSDGGAAIAGFTRSFGFGYFDVYVLRTDNLGNVRNNFFRGNVFYDLNTDCVSDAGEYGLHNWLVEVAGEETYFGLTDEDGNFEISVTEGDYSLSLIPLNAYWDVSCGNAINLTIGDAGPYDTIAIDFPVQSAYDCAWLEVDLSTPFLRRCFDNQYTVSYCNDGTVLVNDAEIEVTLDPFLTLNSSTLDWSGNDGNTYFFEVGDLDVGECGQFYLNVSVDCDSTVLGQTHCSDAHIFPDTICLPTNNWSGASVELSASCQEDEVLFILKNVGVNPTSELEYIVIEDHVILREVVFDTLPPGDTIEIREPAIGTMLRMESMQEPGHPGNSAPSVSVEGCSAFDNGPLSLGYLTQYQEDDSNPFISIDCQENVGSWDPNDKRGFPKGYQEGHYIEENTELEYIIRFQNTGTDTAFRVVIRDTISPWLDVRTLQAGAASHPYDLKVYDSGIVKFIFDDIALPDSTTNEVASHGFVKFRIDQQLNNPVGTVIHNSAAIYFDFNEPIITNQTFHTIGLDIEVGVPEIYLPRTEVKVYPNPFNEWTVFEIQTEQALGTSIFELYDGQGRLVRQEEFSGPRFEFHRKMLASGLYFYQIRNKQRLIFGGKLIAH